MFEGKNPPTLLYVCFFYPDIEIYSRNVQLLESCIISSLTLQIQFSSFQNVSQGLRRSRYCTIHFCSNLTGKHCTLFDDEIKTTFSEWRLFLNLSNDDAIAGNDNLEDDEDFCVNNISDVVRPHLGPWEYKDCFRVFVVCRPERQPWVIAW